MEIKIEQIKSLQLIGNELTVNYVGRNDKYAESKLVLEVKVKEGKVGEKMLYM